MQIRPLRLAGSFEVTPVQHRDERGTFLEWYRFDRFAEAVGHPLDLRQGNVSVSRRGALRGIHFADVGYGQAKYITVLHGAVIDYVVDVRVGSPDFGRWEAVRLDDVDRRALYLAEGLGHAFLALQPETVVSYLVSDTHQPESEHAINPLDPTIGLVLPEEVQEPLVSARDRSAPSLDDAALAGILPEWEQCVRRYAELDAGAAR